MTRLDLRLLLQRESKMSCCFQEFSVGLAAQFQGLLDAVVLEKLMLQTFVLEEHTGVK
jgi:hypothetical protein